MPQITGGNNSFSMFARGGQGAPTAAMLPVVELALRLHRCLLKSTGV